jgi:hypothetical protein
MTLPTPWPSSDQGLPLGGDRAHRFGYTPRGIGPCAVGGPQNSSRCVRPSAAYRWASATAGLVIRNVFSVGMLWWKAKLPLGDGNQFTRAPTADEAAAVHEDDHPMRPATLLR